MQEASQAARQVVLTLLHLQLLEVDLQVMPCRQLPSYPACRPCQPVQFFLQKQDSRECDSGLCRRAKQS